MPITPETRDRLTSSVSQLVRTGRHVSSRAAVQLYGELPSFGWALLVPLERHGDQRCSVLALQVGVDVSVASRQIAVLERLGYVERRPDPQDGRASLLRLT
ncbi:MAG: transcriptional regulator, MarR family, partial [Blastococcus sp.]|nr:transcriptional regulator, MarR family [Blastococcus sp.]